MNEYLSPDNLFVYMYSFLRIILVLLIASLVNSVLKRNLELLVFRVLHLPKDDPRRVRTKTLILAMTDLFGWGIWILAALVILSELGINVTALIVGIGVIGVVVGIGAQSFIRDVISGLLILFEDLISIGDTVKVGELTGTVEHIGLGITKIRKFNGELWIIPNSQLTHFGNSNKDFSRAIVNIGVAYDQNLDDVLKVLEEVSSLWSRANHEIIIEYPRVQAITEFGATEVMLRMVAKVNAKSRYSAERDMRLLIKQQFDKRNVDMPLSRRSVYVHNEEGQAREIDLEELDILPEPGSPEELKDPSLSSMVFEREVKRMAGAMGRIKNLLDPNDKKKGNKDGGNGKPFKKK